jgi:hypothetical protein
MNLTICKCDEQKKSNMMSLTTQTNIVPTNLFFLFFWTKNHQMITLFQMLSQIFGKNSPFSQKELPKLPPILGSL